MINVLAIDTSTNYVTCGIAQVTFNGSVTIVAEREVDNVRGHMELLTPNIVECLDQANLRPSDLDSVVIGSGPGPFTGLRVGMATGAAFADAHGLPLHSVPSLSATAWQHAVESPLVGSGPRRVVVLADARRREWYHAAYQLEAGRQGLECRCVSHPAVAAPDDVVTGYGLGRGVGEKEEDVRVLAGASIADAVAGHAPNVSLTFDAHPTAAGLILAAIAAERSVVGLLRHVDPPRALYLRRPDAVVPKLKGISQAVDVASVQEGELAANQRYDVGGDGGGAEAAPAVDSMALRVVALEPDHAPLVAELEKQLFADEAPWSAETVRMAIATPFTSFLGLFLGDELVGYADLAVLGSAEDPEAEVQNIAIAPEHQGKGYARLLMDPMMAIADAVGAQVFLEVRTDNEPAVGLYKKYGFEAQGVRKGYYQPSGADAFTMMRPVGGCVGSATGSFEAGSSGGSTDGAAGADGVGGAGCADGDGGAAGAAGAAGADGDAPMSGVRAPQDGEQFILGVESSCDETGVGILRIANAGQTAGANVGDGVNQSAAKQAGPSIGPTLQIVADQVASSMDEHARFGGVVPEIASRAHLEAMQPVMRAALEQAGITRPTAVAATIGPGLAGALLVGAAAAKGYAAAWEVPFYAVNHLGGHVAVDTLVEGVEASKLDNAIALLVSGGHTQILHVEGVGKPMEELGSTLDDAAGEAYDKVARLLGLGYPGGPIIDRLAAQGNPKAIAFPRGMMRQQDSRYDFSFSGLKTAVARYVEQAEKAGETILVEDLCASFQEAAVDVLTVKALRACEDKGSKVLLLGGGVSANKRLRELAAERCAAAGVELHVPPLRLCTDNGVMVAALAAHLILAGAKPSRLDVATDPSLEVETPLL